MYIDITVIFLWIFLFYFFLQNRAINEQKHNYIRTYSRWFTFPNNYALRRQRSTYQITIIIFYFYSFVKAIQ